MAIVPFIVMFVAFVVMLNFAKIINVVLIPPKTNVVSAWRCVVNIFRYNMHDVIYSSNKLLSTYISNLF